MKDEKKDPAGRKSEWEDKGTDALAALQRWQQQTLNPALQKMPERAAHFETTSGIELERLYLPLPSEPFLGFPGSFPFTRGIQPTKYRARLWTMRQYAGFGSAEETNARYHYLLSQGQTGLSVAFDLPTQMGYDSDHPLARGEVGKVGVAISTLDDMAALFKDIPLDQVSTSMTINATAGILLAMYCVLAERQGLSLKRLRGTIQNDILKEYVARGAYIFPPRPSLRLVTDIIVWCARETPEWNPISISGYHIREAGANAIQELAFTFANGIEYIKSVLAAGLRIDEFAPRLSFFFAAHSHILEEVAKFRAARRLWAKILRERWNASDESCKLRFHTQTGGVTLTAQQPDNNIVRVAFQALAAVLGGTQSLHTNARDEALSLPTPESATLALRTQQIIAHETGVADTVDPLGGSYCIERLTDEIEHRVRQLLEQVESRGGAAQAIEQGFVQEQIAESAYEYQKQIETGERVVVGLNRYLDSSAAPQYGLLRIDSQFEANRAALLARHRAKRNQFKVLASLKSLQTAAESSQNLMPAIMDAVRAECTVGEISDALRRAFGEHDRRA